MRVRGERGHGRVCAGGRTVLVFEGQSLKRWREAGRFSRCPGSVRTQLWLWEKGSLLGTVVDAALVGAGHTVCVFNCFIGVEET